MIKVAQTDKLPPFLSAWLQKPCPTTKTIKYSPLSKINYKSFNADLNQSELGQMKHHNQKLERKANQVSLTVESDIHKVACNRYNKSLTDTKVQYYNNIISEAAGDQDALFSLIDRLLHCSSSSPLPSHESPTELANKFAEFFDGKIAKIHKLLSTPDQSDLNHHAPHPCQPSSRLTLWIFLN